MPSQVTLITYDPSQGHEIMHYKSFGQASQEFLDRLDGDLAIGAHEDEEYSLGAIKNGYEYFNWERHSEESIVLICDEQQAAKLEQAIKNRNDGNRAQSSDSEESGSESGTDTESVCSVLDDLDLSGINAHETFYVHHNALGRACSYVNTKSRDKKECPVCAAKLEPEWDFESRLPLSERHSYARS